MASAVPRTDLVIGSPEWARRTLSYVKDLWHSVENSRERWLRAVDELRQGRAWELFGKNSLDELLKTEIGFTLDESCVDLHERVKAEINAARELQPTGRPKKGIGPYTFTAKGPTSARLAARLKRHHPDICARIDAGEFTSIHAAAMAAGIVKPKSPLKELRRWWRKASSETKATFRREIA